MALVLFISVYISDRCFSQNVHQHNDGMVNVAVFLHLNVPYQSFVQRRNASQNV